MLLGGSLSAVAAVRGTEFTLEVEHGKTVLYLKEGNVLLIAEGVGELVSTGQTSPVNLGNPPLDSQKISGRRRSWL